MIKSKTLWFAVLSVLQGFIFQLPLPPFWQAVVGCVIVVAAVKVSTTKIALEN